MHAAGGSERVVRDSVWPVTDTTLTADQIDALRAASPGPIAGAQPKPACASSFTSSRDGWVFLAKNASWPRAISAR